MIYLEADRLNVRVASGRVVLEITTKPEGGKGQDFHVAVMLTPEVGLDAASEIAGAAQQAHILRPRSERT